MDTAPLKSFATWARNELIREVTARVAVVLAPASLERVEQPKAVEALENAVKASSGGDKGKAAVAERVAYTWFNRIIALRFMDANGYTDIGVVSPQVGIETGQPEILAEAKRGNIDTAVVGRKTRETVTALLNGTRRSGDAQGEGYALLLADYCRYWNRAMPFMFEREGDFTELLIPANLLADDSVASRVVKVMTTDVCQDVEVIGWLYQFYISERKDEVFAGFKKNKKAGTDEIPAATQLFTPHWIVRYLVENSLGRLWMLNHPSSRLVDQMDYYIAPIDEEMDVLRVNTPEDLKILDPACGSGHMLTYAFDLMYAIYEEEGYAPADIPVLILTNNLYGTEIDPRAGALAAFALAMKARARQRTFFNKHIDPNICVLEPISFSSQELDFLSSKNDREEEAEFWNQFAHADTFGSLIQPDPRMTTALARHLDQLDDGGDLLTVDTLNRAKRAIMQADYLAQRYSAVVANPPYMDARNMGGALYDHVVENFPDGYTGLDLSFALRAEKLVESAGFIGLLNMDSWLSNVECAAFRDVIRKRLAPRVILHLGPRAFPEIGGEVVRVSATLFQRVAPGRSRAIFICATDGTTIEAKTTQFRNRQLHFVHRLDWFDVFPGKVLTAYAASQKAHDAFSTAPAMNSIAEVRTGLQTGDNGRFLRYWHEVSCNNIRASTTSDTVRWVPYVKSASPTRWFAREDFVVDWRHDGSEIRRHPGARPQNISYYFRSGISFGGLAGSLKGRLVSAGAIFDQKNSMVFPLGNTTAGQLLALMNSPAFESLARLVSPKGFGVGTMARLPIPPNALSTPRIEDLAARTVALTTILFDRSEISRGFAGLKSILLDEDEYPELHLSVEAAIKREVEIQTEILELERENSKFFAETLLAAPMNESSIGEFSGQSSESELIRDIVSYAVGCMFGRYSLDQPGLILADQGATLQDYITKVSAPTFEPDPDNVIPIVDGDWFEDDIVARFRKFLRMAFGEEHFEKNLRFITDALGVKDLRDYFVKSFHKDHVQRYKKRPIYWLFSSPKGSFNALIYMHRYTPSTVSTVLNEYLREFRAKLASSFEQQERLATGKDGTPRQQAAAQKEADRLRKVLVELEEYEHDVLYPLASRQLAIDLDDGVKVNYPKFGAALKKIPGLEASSE
ncbi:BREX-1 system adenine-specific DNA-methyltransferase PglX [Nocardia tengchongensis]|uniref:BREX-1 system adenine-specific DNA-methyltransferase PglX n=1 Tax=Nocardia tengchongensis TaxID=2055889 RepID=UPI0033C241E1